MAKQLRCYVGWRRWVKKVGPGGQIYAQCRDCGKEDESGRDMHVGPSLPG
jgi:hypothetical protein